ncbi:uncharacterized protein LOC134710560 [Mytilus trossulus]|uniref:uncharacterized protein LOC134710560 n=1 Tax=Mytilus trossulus TaxID=6551 RepID=UPI0030049042
MDSYHLIRLKVICIAFVKIYCFDNVIKPSCQPDEEICEFHWTVAYFQTMTVILPNGKGSRSPIENVNGTLYVRTNCGPLDNMREVTDNDYFVSGDGHVKFMFAINDQVPGPSIVVYEGQQIVVHVHNKLMMEGVSIHWHGLFQKGTPFMDGVARVTQCPINPGETFTYRFEALPYGTFWYHSHLGAQRSDGIAGAFIILKRPQLPTDTVRQNEEEFVFLVQDWFQRGFTHEVKLANWHLNKYIKTSNGESCTGIKKTYDGSIIGQKGIQTPLINAKGRFQEPSTNINANYLPLETFVVTSRQKYLFRMIGIQSISTYRISIDNHKLNVLAIDGADIEPEETDYVIIHSGERYDVEVLSNAPVGNYWIRLEDLASQDIAGNPIPMVVGYGILRYDGAPKEDPISSGKDCTKRNPCRVVNCIFGTFPADDYTSCIPVSKLKSKEHEIETNPVPVMTSENDLQEFFLSFHYSLPEDNPGLVVSTINNFRMVLPTSPPMLHEADFVPEKACPKDFTTFASQCNHILELKLGNVIQFVLVNVETKGFGRPHPIHIHGHRFHVMKIGFPTYDPITGNMTEMNQDIVCESQHCDRARWADPSWSNGNVPGMNTMNPAIKDTLVLPWGAYAVVRILADNPGYWYMHCHIELHNVDGMALILQEGARSDMPKPADDMHFCGNSNNNQTIKPQTVLNNVVENLLVDAEEKGLTTESKVSVSSLVGTIVVSVVITLSLVFNVVSMIILLRRKLYTYHSYIPEVKISQYHHEDEETIKLLK